MDSWAGLLTVWENLYFVKKSNSVRVYGDVMLSLAEVGDCTASVFEVSKTLLQTKLRLLINNRYRRA